MSNNTEMNNVPVIIPISTGNLCGRMENFLDAFKRLISEIDEGKIELPEISVSSMNFDFLYQPMWRIPMVNPKPITLPKYSFRTCRFSNFEPVTVKL